MTQTILVIDDDAAVRGSFQLVLGEIGCVVRVAEDGRARHRHGQRRTSGLDLSGPENARD